MIRPISVIIAAVLLLGPLVTVELGLRALIDQGRLQEAPTSNEFADVSLTNLRRAGRPDVLIMGMSTMRSGVKPDTLERRIEEDLGRPVSVQNVAQGGISLESQRIIVKQLAEQGLLPSIVITGVSPVTLAGENVGEDEDWFRRSELGRLWSGCDAGVHEEDGLSCRLSEISALWRWRSRPQDVVTAITEGIPRTIDDGGRILRPSGWLSGRPADDQQLERNLPRALERMNEEVVVSEDLAQAWSAYIDELRANDVEVIALRMPYYEPFIEALVERNPHWAEQRDAGYARLEEAADLPLIEIPGFDDVAEAEWFRDPRHLSRAGAAPFTRQMWAQDEVSEPVLEVLRSED